MSKKNTDLNLLIPGESGWDIWSYTSEELNLLTKTDEHAALEIEKFPTNKPLLMAFPVRELTALELWIPSGERDSVADLVDLQVEKLGLAQDESLGSLTQHHYIQESSDGLKSLYGIDILKAPTEGDLPIKSPDKFSISPKCYLFQQNTVTYWVEFGKWVMAITNSEGQLIHYQAFTNSALGADLINDANFVIGQLMIQQIITTQPANFVIWTSEHGVRPEGYDIFERKFGKSLDLVEKPKPQIPPLGNILPADARAERVAKKRRQKQTILTVLIALLALAGIGYAGYSLWDLEKRADTAEIEAGNLNLETQDIQDHVNKWEELAPLVDTEYDTLSLLKKVTKAIPNQNLRITRAEFKNQLSEQEERSIISISITGESPNFGDASKFDENLQKSKDLNFTWRNQDPSKTKTGWRFIYTADKN